MLKEGAARTRYLSHDEEEMRLIAAATAHASVNLGKQGRRSGKRSLLRSTQGYVVEELFGLTWKQVDLRRGLIDTGTKTKSGRARKVPVPARSAQILARVSLGSISGFVLVNPESTIAATCR